LCPGPIPPFPTFLRDHFLVFIFCGRCEVCSTVIHPPPIFVRFVPCYLFMFSENPCLAATLPSNGQCSDALEDNFFRSPTLHVTSCLLGLSHPVFPPGTHFAPSGTFRISGSWTPPQRTPLPMLPHCDTLRTIFLSFTLAFFTEYRVGDRVGSLSRAR